MLCVYGVFLHIPDSPLQYQTVFFAPTIWQALVCAVSFFCVESPRWLLLVGRNDEAVRNLVSLRGLPADHPRVASEVRDIQYQIQKEQTEHGNGVRSTSWQGIKSIFHETFMVKANLRRAQQAMIAYSLAQLSGANSITSYFVPILALTGQEPGEAHSLFLTGMYSLSKFFFTIMASFFFIDALGRRNSLFCGATIQMVSDIYVGVFIKYNQEGPVSHAASQGAIAMLFVHGFGFAIGTLLPQSLLTYTY